MKIAAYVHPVVQSLGPNFSCGWFQILAKLLQTLRRDAGCECMMIAGEWPYRWAKQNGQQHLAEGLRIAALDEIALYRKLSATGKLPTTLDQLAYREGQQNHAALRIITEEVERCTGDFQPDVVISFAIQIDFLSALWPNALRLHVETGAFSRNPYPFSLFFDHLGMYARSIIGKAGNRLRTLAATDDALGLVSAFRSRNALVLDAIDPFQLADLRKRFDRLVLLPLQVSNYYSFDEQTHYRSQFEYLLDVLARTPRNVGLVVTEYLEWGHVLKSHGSAENLAYLQANFPNLIFLDQFRSYSSPSQFLVPRVDGIWSVSSNVSYQGLLYNRLLGTPETSHLAGIAHATRFDDFFRKLDAATVDNDAVLAWILERYLVPDFLLSNGRWLRNYLAERADAARTAADPLAAFVPIADLDRLIEAWVIKAPNPRVVKTQEPFDAVVADANAARRSLDAVLDSRSWRITGPLRKIAGAGRTALAQIKSGAAAKKRSGVASNGRIVPSH